MRYRIVTLSALFLFYTVALFGQDKSNRGKEFWLGYGFNRHFLVPNDQNVLNSQELVLYISTEQAATVTVSVNNTGWNQTLNIPANSANASVVIPKSGVNDARIINDGLSTKAIHIVSDVPVAVYAHQYDVMFSAATMLMPVESYGFINYSINWPQTLGNSKLPAVDPGSWNYRHWNCYFYVIASEDNTKLEITPADTTMNGWLPGQVNTITLNKGEIYTVFGKANYISDFSASVNSSKDMTGSKVIAVPGADGKCHPFTLFSGSGGVRMCYADGGEAMMQQVFPVQSWGTRYLTYHTISNENTDFSATHRNYYKICVADPTSVVKRNGVPLTGLIRNFYYDIMDSTGGDYIESDKPITVAQFTPNRNQCWRPPTGAPLQPPFPYGDPEMFYLSPIEQGQKSVVFYSSDRSSIQYIYTNIHLPANSTSSLRIDGNTVPASNIITHPQNSSYAVAFARMPLLPGPHSITCDSGFNAIVYGLGLFESYGYNVGTFVNNLNNYTTIRNTLNSTTNIDTFTCPKTPFRITAKLAYPATSITWRLSQVPGLFPNTDSVIATPVSIGTEIINGRTYYLYTLQQDFTFNSPGIYTIPLSYTAIGVENCSQTEYAKLEVLVKPGPVADFSFINQCFRDTVRFTGTSTTTGFTINSYLWTFHDATTQSTVNAKKLYPAPGNYDVRYQILADNGCFGDTTKNITVSTGTTPTLTITSSGKPCADSVITFTSSITPNVSNPTTWYWDFGDGQTATSNTSHIITHSYAANAGPITVKHLATLTTGCNPDTVTSVIPVINTNPVASFTVTGSPSCPSKPLQVTSSAANVNVWNWNFGNNSFGNQVPPFSYSYTAPGNFNIQLTVSDNNGCGSAVISNPVIINPGPSVNAGPDKLISLGTSTTLDATIVNAANYDFLWSPAQTLSSATILNPVATPDVVTTYTIIAADKVTGCSGRDAVVVSPIPKLYIPTGFTPNNDGKNDKWTIQGLALYPDAVVSVYNRWGEKVYETKNYYNYPWNGLYKGLMIPGLYVYVIKLYPDKPEVIKGMVTIIQ